MEDPDAPVELRPLKDFSDEYADPTEYITVDQWQVGPKSAVVQGLIDGECCGWVKQPTSDELYEAMQAQEPTDRQRSLAGILLRADFWELMGAWMEAAFTWRQLARAMSRREYKNPTRVREINRSATGRS